MVISTEDGLPTLTLDGRLPSETVKVSSSSSASRVVWMVPVPVVCPPVIVMFVSVPMSPASADPTVSVTGTDTLFVRAADNLALTVTGCPSFTGLGEAERLTVGTGGWRSVKVSLAMRTLENLPVPAMLVIVPCGTVAGLLSEKSVPSSVPASYGKRSTSIEVLHSSDPSSNDCPDIPTNQSGLGPIMDRSVTRGCDLLAVMENDAVPVPPPLTPCSITFSVCALA